MIWRLANSLACLLAAVLTAGAAQGGGGPQNVAVIVNPTNQDSLEVANAYIELRQIPRTNVFYIPWPAPGPRASGVQVREKIIQPILAEIERRGLKEQIDCVTFSTGYPYAVDCTPLFSGKQLSGPSRPILSLTSALYLHQFLMEGGLELLALNSNLYFAATTPLGCNSRAFSATSEWGAGGQVVESGGYRYLMATALGVSHGRGNTPTEIISILKRARGADGTKPPGTIYYMRNNDVRSRARHDTFAAAVKELQQLNVKAEIVNGSTPLQKADVAGLTTGTPLLNLRTSGSTILPGALVDNLTSGAGQFVVPPTALHPQTPLTEFLRLGAAGASGAVVEPYAIPAKFPSAMLHVHYVRGCSLAESFYQAVSGPFQLIIVGDPLCQPWAIAPEVTISGLPADGAVSGRLELVPTATYPDSRRASRFELFIDGKRTQTIQPGERFQVASNTLPDGYVELRVVAIDNTPIAVQGSWIQLINIKNGQDAVQLTLTESPTTMANGTLAVEIASTTTGKARLLHNGRELGVLSEGSGKLQIPASRLGRGRVELYVQQQGSKALRSRPLVVEIH
jgi:hypothetical protein